MPVPSRRTVTFGIAAVGLSQLGIALWIALDPRGFFDALGPFGTYNPHYLGDAAAFQAGLGLALLAALRWPALRAGVLVATLASTALHALNHWLDVDEAHAGSDAGLGDAVSLTVLALLLAGMLAAELQEPAR